MRPWSVEIRILRVSFGARRVALRSTSRKAHTRAGAIDRCFTTSHSVLRKRRELASMWRCRSATLMRSIESSTRSSIRSARCFTDSRGELVERGKFGRDDREALRRPSRRDRRPPRHRGMRGLLESSRERCESACARSRHSNCSRLGEADRRRRLGLDQPEHRATMRNPSKTDAGSDSESETETITTSSQSSRACPKF